MKGDPCDRCQSKNTIERPTIIEHEDGKREENHDTLDAKCLDCHKEWIVVCC